MELGHAQGLAGPLGSGDGGEDDDGSGLPSVDDLSDVEIADSGLGWGTSEFTGATGPRRDRFRVVVDAHLLLMRDGAVLLGRRQNTGYGDGAYHPPAGHLEASESIVAALVREAREEVGIEIAEADVVLAHTMHNASGEGRIAFFFTVDQWTGEIRNMEPDKCAELRWFPLDDLPKAMIDYARVAIDHYARGRLMSVYGWT